MDGAKARVTDLYSTVIRGSTADRTAVGCGGRSPAGVGCSMPALCPEREQELWRVRGWMPITQKPFVETRGRVGFRADLDCSSD